MERNQSSSTILDYWNTLGWHHSCNTKIKVKTDYSDPIFARYLIFKLSKINLSIFYRVRLLLQLAKPRLAILVVLSCVFGYFLFPEKFNPITFLSVITGGYLLTIGSLSLNQIVERKYDSKMERTANRPLVTGTIPLSTACIFSAITSILGFFILLLGTGKLCAYLGLLSYALYILTYTFLKRHHSISVFFGSISGALPPLLGYLAASSYLYPEAIFLFIVQFLWQFPHFWAIAWYYDEDYTKVQFKVLPSRGGKSKLNAIIILFYNLLLVFIGFLSPFFGFGFFTLFSMFVLGIFFFIPSYKLFTTLEDKFAKKLMFSSFYYLPLTFICMLIDVYLIS